MATRLIIFKTILWDRNFKRKRKTFKAVRNLTIIEKEIKKF